MKFVAAKHFYNAKELNLQHPCLRDANGAPVLKEGKLQPKLAADGKTALPMWPHPLHVPLGYRFEYGTGADGKTSESFDGIVDDAQKQVALKLLAFGLAVHDNDSAKSRDAIKQIDEQVRLEKESAAATPEVLDLPTAVASAVAESLAPVLKQIGDVLAALAKK